MSLLNNKTLMERTSPEQIIAVIRKRHSLPDSADVRIKVLPMQAVPDPQHTGRFKAVINTDDIDRDSEVVLPQGMDATEFEKSGAIFWAHNYNLPVAKPYGKMVRQTKGWEAGAEFAKRPDDYKGEFFPDFAKAMVSQGIVRGVSIGFIPTEVRNPTKKDIEVYGDGVKRIISKWRLLEWSIAPVQSNPNAFVTEAIAKGFALTDEGLLSAKDVTASLSARTEAQELLTKAYAQYLVDRDGYEPAGDSSPALGKNIYRIVLTPWGVRFCTMQFQTDELCKFDNSVMHDVLSEIDKFWDLKPDYDKLGLMHTRGLLLYGPPGTGKTSVMHQVAEMVVGRGDVVFYARSIGALADGLTAFREIEPDRKVVVVLEDADEYIGYNERQFLQILDGEQSIPGVCYLASTNYVERFPARLLRPGRFDKKIYIGPPPYEGRLAYLKAKLAGIEADAAKIEWLATETDGLSFGHMRELVTAVYALKEKPEDVLVRLRDGNLPVSQRGAESVVSHKKLNTDDQQVHGIVEMAKREIGSVIEGVANVVVEVNAQPKKKRLVYFIDPPADPRNVAAEVKQGVADSVAKAKGRVYVI